MEILQFLLARFNTVFLLITLFYCQQGYSVEPSSGADNRCRDHLGCPASIRRHDGTVGAVLRLDRVYVDQQFYAGRAELVIDRLRGAHDHGPIFLLFSSIPMFCAISVFSLNNTEFDVFMMTGFGVFGYTHQKIGVEPALMLLDIIIGSLMEKYCLLRCCFRVVIR
jgi:hypothetical protein